jgi:hypothetical protein
MIGKRSCRQRRRVWRSTVLASPRRRITAAGWGQDNGKDTRAVIRHMDNGDVSAALFFVIDAGVKRIDTALLNDWLCVATQDRHFLQRETDAIAHLIFHDRCRLA